MILLYIVKNKSNKIKVITDQEYQIHPDQSWMQFSNAMATYYLGKAFTYESDALSYQKNRKFFIISKKKKLKEFYLKDYKQINEKWSHFSKRMKKSFKGDIYHSLEDAIRFV